MSRVRRGLRKLRRSKRLAVVWARVLLLLGSAVIVVSGVVAVVCVHDVHAYHRAQLCPGSAPTLASQIHGCIAEEFGVVTGRSQVATNDEGGTNYYVDFRPASGGVQTGQVNEDVYDAAMTGRSVLLYTWQGSVVWIFVGNASAGLYAPAESILSLSLLVGWLGVGMVVWSLACRGQVYDWLIGPLRTFVFIVSGLGIGQAGLWVLDYGVNLEVDLSALVLFLLSSGCVYLGVLRLRIYSRSRKAIGRTVSRWRAPRRPAATDPVDAS